MAFALEGANPAFIFCIIQPLGRESSAAAVARRARQFRSTGQRLSPKDRRKRIAAGKQTRPDASLPELSPPETRNWPAKSPPAYRPHRPATPGSSCSEARGHRASPTQPRTVRAGCRTKQSSPFLFHRLLGQARCRDLRQSRSYAREIRERSASRASLLWKKSFPFLEQNRRAARNS